jgi:hypothetical protein
MTDHARRERGKGDLWKEKAGRVERFLELLRVPKKINKNI